MYSQGPDRKTETSPSLSNEFRKLDTQEMEERKGQTKNDETIWRLVTARSYSHLEGSRDIRKGWLYGAQRLEPNRELEP